MRYCDDAMRRVLLLMPMMIVATILRAQPPNPDAPDPLQVKLTIKVVDSSTGAGVPDAVLLISSTEREVLEAPDTDPMGVSTVMVAKNSSLAIMAGTPGYPVAHAEAAVGKEALTVTVPLVRGATIFGHVVDADTKLPVSDVPVQIWKLSFLRGMPQIEATGGAAQTKADGRFEAASLPAGDYIVETYAPRNASVQSPGVQSPGYGRQVWPGGRDFADATPLSVPSGATFDFGTIAIEKRRLATIAYRILGDCAGRLYNVRLVQTFARGAMDRAQEQSIGCDRTSSFAQVPPGSYGVVATSAASSGKTADAWIEVTDSDISIDLSLRSTPLTTIRGRVLSKIGEAAERGIPGVSVRFLSGANVGGLVAGMPLAQDSADANGAGSFGQPLYIPPGGKVAVEVEGLPANLYVESLRYNGTQIHSDEFVLNEFAMAQDLDVICSDKFGVVSGEVLNKDIGPVDILLVPWPNDGADYPSGPIEVHGDPDGKFTFNQVRPGHYKAVAVRSGDRQKFEAPFRLMRALPNALDVNIASGAGNNVRIEKVED